MSDLDILYRDPVAYLNARMSYLQGSSRDTARPGPVSSETVFVPGTRYEFQISGIGREDKQSPTPPTDARLWRQPFGDLLAGAYTYRVPVVYRITSTPGSGVSLSLGTWSRGSGADESCLRRAEVLRSLLGVQYPVVHTTEALPLTSAAGFAFRAGALVCGHPMAKPPVLGDNVLPIDG